jgi:drug/metabolite transporter (DMT)-like permease
MQSSRTVLWGILLALGGSLVLSVNDMAVKALSGDYPLHQVVLTRSIIGMGVVLLLLAWARGPRDLLGGVTTRRPGIHLLRVLCVLGSNIFYFLGLAALPLADGVAMFFVAPLLLTALSVPLLGEKVGPRRWAAVGAGLLGVLVMMRPGAGALQPAAMLVLLSALAYALMHILTRRMAATEGALAMSFWTQVGFIAVSCAMGLTVGDGHLGQTDNASLAFLLRAWHWPRRRTGPSSSPPALRSPPGGS